MRCSAGGQRAAQAPQQPPAPPAGDVGQGLCRKHPHDAQQHAIDPVVDVVGGCTRRVASFERAVGSATAGAMASASSPAAAGAGDLDRGGYPMIIWRWIDIIHRPVEDPLLHPPAN